MAKTLKRLTAEDVLKLGPEMHADGDGLYLRVLEANDGTRAELAGKAASLEMALDASETIGATNSVERWWSSAYGRASFQQRVALVQCPRLLRVRRASRHQPNKEKPRAAATSPSLRDEVLRSLAPSPFFGVAYSCSLRRGCRVKNHLA